MSEYTHVEKPFMDQLATLGWDTIDQGAHVIPTDPSRSLRTSFRQLILPREFREGVGAINRMPDRRTWLDETQFAELEDQLFRHPGLSLLEANEQVQQRLFGTVVNENPLTGEANPSVRLIDFETPENNRFTAINQFRVDTPGCVKDFIIPDIVLFVNGLPLVVVEAKIGDRTGANPMYEAFIQLLRYRNGRPATERAGLKEGEEKLFYPNLFLVRSCGEEADLGTITGGETHFYGWRTIWPEALSAFTPPLGTLRAQEILIQGALNKYTLLDMLRNCSVYKDTEDGQRIKVVARYQQHRAARKIAERLATKTSPAERGGVVWHTQGSGKSLTMVFAARMLRSTRALADFKIVMVNDRVDLEDQLSETATLIGGKVNVIESAVDLRASLATGASDLNMVMIHKFQDRDEGLPDGVAEILGGYAPPPKAETFGVVNESDRILIMIDEAHRTQGSDMGNNLFEAFPNATRIAFTGTPLISERHGGKRTVKRFGEYIDEYKILDAVADGATLQIFYQGRTADIALKDKAGFDDAFEDLFKERTEEEILAIKKKYGATGDLMEAEKRIEAIACDIVDHYIADILPNGFKAQVVCHSKLAALRYRNAIRKALEERLARERAEPSPDQDLIRKIAFLKAAVVISGDGTNEAAEITAVRKEARALDVVANFCKPFDFDTYGAENTGIAFLIVCDMLLTGFDAPVEQVMYIDKKLKEHNLLQAIARVNRVRKGKQYGLVVDYVGLANHLNQALSIYAGEDAEDLKEGLKRIDSEIPILEERYRRLLHHFQDLGVANIEGFVMGSLPSPEDEIAVLHRAVDALEKVKERADFEVFLKKFLQSLDVILPAEAGQRYRVPAARFEYLLRMARQRYKDSSISIAGVGEKVKALINKHVVDLGINPQIEPVGLLDPDFLDKAQGHSHGHERAKASEMEHAIRKHCTVKFDEDPAFYRRMSEKLEETIRRHGDDWRALVESFTILRTEIASGRAPEKAGRDRELAALQDNIAELLSGDGPISEEAAAAIAPVSEAVLDIARERVGLVDFWNRPDEIRRLRADIAQQLLLSGAPELVHGRQKVAAELVQLIEKRHEAICAI